MFIDNLINAPFETSVSSVKYPIVVSIMVGENINIRIVIGTDKKKIFGVFRRGGFSSKIRFIDHFKEEIQIRLDNKQNKFLVFMIIVYKSIRHIKKIIKDFK